MPDDKNIGPGGSSEDPWSGLDADPTSEAGESFDFFSDFDTLAEEPAATAAAEPVTPLVSPPPAAGASDEGPQDEPALAASHDDEAIGLPSFDALSLGAQDGVYSDDAVWDAGDPEPVAEVESMESVESPEASEPPLTVFSPAEAPAAPEEHPALPGFDTFDVAVAGDVADADADAMAHLEDSADADGDPGIVSFAPSETPPSPGPESLEFGMDESLVVGESGSGDGESLVGRSLVDGSTVQIGTGRSGILPFEDWAESPDATATGEAAASPAEVDHAEADHDDDFGVAAFDDGSGVENGDENEDAIAHAAAAAPVAVARPRRVIRRRSGGGVVGVLLALILGGVLAFPIAFGILFWVFKKDPFQMAPKVPASLAFLLPPEFRIAGQGDRTPPKLPGRQDAVVASRSVEDLVADGGAPQDASAESRAVETGTGSGDTAESVAVSSKPEARKPPTLDTSALDAAVAAAERATDRLLAVSSEDPTYKRLLKEWYTTLSSVGEQTVAVEQKAAESGAEFVAVTPAARRTIGRILADERANEQFAKLSRMWLKSRGRTSDGVVLPAVLGGSRKVGAWWVSRVRVSDDPAVPELTVLSRSQPGGSEGDAVVVLGLVFEPGVVWAAECGRFEPETAASPPAAGGDDLFPLE